MDKVTAIFNKIYSLSESEKIKWSVASTDKTSFTTSIADFKITINFNSMTHGFFVADKEGNEIAQTHRAIVPRSENTDLPVNKLYDMAKRNALNIDKSLDDLINNLNKI